MSNFFDKNFLQGVIISGFFLMLSLWLSGSQRSSNSGKRWKVSVILGNAMILGGLYMFAVNFPNGHFNNPYSGMGFCIFILGIPMKYFGKFMVWWHR